MSEIKHIDYVGFTFNGIHSSSLGIVRTSDGSRFNENLLPTIQDKTVQVPGGDGMYHFGSYYTQKQFNVSYAFDSLTEEQLARIKQVFGDKKIHDLTFDEAPYKTYQVKVTGTSSIKHIPFAEGATNRVYKGEGSIQFTAYDPFARSVRKFLDDEYYSNYNNIQEWQGAARLKESQGVYDLLGGTNGNGIKLYNPGVKETDFVLTFNFNNESSLPAGRIYLKEDNINTLEIKLEQIKRQGEDDQIKINSRLNLIEGYKNGVKTGTVYNKHIIAGTFFKIPCSLSSIDPNNEKSIWLIIDRSNSLQDYFDSIQYDYYYF